MSTNNQIQNNQGFTQQSANREELLEYIEAEMPFSDQRLQAKFKDLCLSLFDKCNSLFSTYQITTLIQVATCALARSVEINKVEIEGELKTVFDTSSHILELTPDVRDTYQTKLTNKASEIVEKREDVYVDDFLQIMDTINEQAQNQN